MIQINNLYKSYGIAETKVDVLKGIDLNIAAGKLVCLLGPSGSGKSTLLNILGGIERIDKGSVTVFNHELEKMNNKELTLYRRNNVGFVFQFYKGTSKNPL
ncbi:MAG: ATP-binding cassette domain-containing protein [Treponemataceae bacterium]